MKHYLYRVITGEIGGFFPAFLLALLTPLSYIYGVLVKIQGALYDFRIIKPKRLPCPVISVGNIVAGGTGKTPTVVWIAKALREVGVPVAILLRGYGRQRSGKTAVVSDGKEIFMPAIASGDEAAMIASALPGVSVLVGKQRYATGRFALQLWRGHNDGIIILDDGFQHRKLARELEIITIDATQPFGTGKRLPAGTLREPASALRRADVILLTRTDLAKSLLQVKRKIEKLAPGIPIVESCHQPTKLYRLGTDDKFDLHLLRGKRLLAVCGIGNPKAFADTLRRCQPKQVELLAFPDHHRYTPTDIVRIQQRVHQTQADLIVTTRKDEQRLQSLCIARRTEAELEGLPFVVLAVELVIISGQDLLNQRLEKVMECS